MTEADLTLEATREEITMAVASWDDVEAIDNAGLVARQVERGMVVAR